MAAGRGPLAGAVQEAGLRYVDGRTTGELARRHRNNAANQCRPGHPASKGQTRRLNELGRQGRDAMLHLILPYGFIYVSPSE